MTRVLVPFGTVTAGALLLAVVAGSAPTTTAPDAFLAYKAKPTKGKPAFVRQEGVLLADRFEVELPFTATKARELLVPVERDGNGPTDPVIHLQAYAIAVSKVCTDDRRPCAKADDCAPGVKCKKPTHAKRPGEAMVDAFGAHVVDVGKPDVLLVPAFKDPNGVPPSPPDFATHAVEHFKCYKAKLAKGSAGVPTGTLPSLGDQFTTPPKTFALGALTRLCTPAATNGAATKNPAAHLLCYKAKPAKKQPKHVKRSGIGITDEFGSLVRDTVAETALCVPAVPAGVATPTVQATPSGQGGATATPQGGTTATPSPGGSPGLPPDPSTVAPPLDDGVATTIGSSTAFLYSGPNPIQSGVAPGTIDPKRAAVVRGKVLDHAGAPLPGATVSILAHPELGQTMSRADGMFDLAVNGGAMLTVKYEKAGLLPAQRQVDAPWQDFVIAPDVMLLALDPQVTAVDLTASVPLQMARGSMMSDADGTRQATLLFAQGTTAEMVMPDGSSQPMTTLNVRATEYTVGADGAMAMPAALPPSSGYTYAVELSTDEAMAAGAATVRFDPPLIQYVENFVGFPVGSLVPTGFYDRSSGQWVASDNGRVIAIVGVTGGLADLDLDGGGTADDAAALAALGVTDVERQRLAALYAPGQSLWRVLIPHFSPWDCNWPYGPPAGSDPPDPKGKSPDRPPNGPDPDCRRGSIIECETQTLGEVVDITGTPFRLHYRSDRVPGRAGANMVQTRISGATLPPGLQRIHVEVLVAGRRFKESFAPAPNLLHTFTWDGMDVYGRRPQGRQPIKVRVGYEYIAQYYATADTFEASYNRFAVAPIVTARGGGGGGGGAGLVTFTRPEARVTSPPIILYQDFDTGIGELLDAGLGGWTLNAHHVYDVVGRVLHLGDGRQRGANAPIFTISTVAGQGGSSQDGIPATEAAINPLDMAVGADGSLYFTDLSSRVRRIGPDGIITTVAGGGTDCGTPPCGDGGLATQTALSLQGFGNPGIAVAPDGSFYVSDRLRYIRRVGPDGIITTVAGNGSTCFPVTDPCGDGGPAREAAMVPTALAVGPDGSIYLLGLGSPRVRRIGPDGIITTVAGTGEICGVGTQPCGDGGPATAAQLTSNMSGITVAPDGTFYVTDGNFTRVRRVSPDGVITNFAGDGTVCSTAACGDGEPAIEAQLKGPIDLALGRDGSLYIAELGNGRFRRVGPDGFITTVAGNGSSSGMGGDGGFPTAADTPGARMLAVAPDGTIYLQHGGNQATIRAVAGALPGLEPGEFPIAAEDGTEVYIFSGIGRHQRTLDALTGAVRLQFSYDGNDRLIALTDADDQVTTIERDMSGNPAAIVAATGQRTTLTVNAERYLSSIANPAGEGVQLAYYSGVAAGLLSTLTDALSRVHLFAYDALGRLVRDEDPAGGVTTLARTDVSDDRYTVTITSTLGRETTYDVEDLPNGETRRIRTDPSGTSTETIVRTDGSRRVTDPDGTVRDLVLGPDPRWGLQAPIPAAHTVTSPGGHVRTTTASRTVALANPADPLSLVSQADTLQINGATYTGNYDAATRTFVVTTPAGRHGTTTLDAIGRPVSIGTEGLTPLAITYDDHGRLASLAEGARAYTLAYDQKGQLALVTGPLMRTVAVAYDDAGRPTLLTLPDSSQTARAYDAAGNLISLTPPGRTPHVFGYTPIGLFESYTPPPVSGGSSALQMTYNLDRQLTQLTRGGTSATIAYDGSGRVQTLTHPADTVTVSYDGVDRPGTLTTTGGPAVTYAYDGLLLTDKTWSGAVAGTVHRTFDDRLRLASRTINGANTQAFAYDADSLLTQAGALTLARHPQHGLITGTTLDTVTDTRTLNGFGEWDGYAATAGATPLLAMQYTHDAYGRTTTRTETIGGVTSTFTYDYDARGRLTEVAKNGITTASYDYDANGNRLSKTTGGTIDATYDAQDRLLSYGATTFGYDDNGDLQSRTLGGQSTVYDYDVFGNLRGVILPGGTQVDYLVDGHNRRLAKRVNGVQVQGFLYDGQLGIVAELDGANAIVSTFVYGSRRNVPDYLVKAGVAYRILADELGSPRLVVNAATGAVAQRMDFDEFGNVLQDTSPGFQPFGFAGGLYDVDTKLVRFGARDYDASVGRWTAKDPSGFRGGDANLYAYVGNDPVNLIDRTGASPQSASDSGSDSAFVAATTSAVSVWAFEKLQSSRAADGVAQAVINAIVIGQVMEKHTAALRERLRQQGLLPPIQDDEPDLVPQDADPPPAPPAPPPPTTPPAPPAPPVPAEDDEPDLAPDDDTDSCPTDD